MKTIFAILIPVLFTPILVSPFHADVKPLHPTSELEQFEWLLGTWENNTPRGSIYESWVRKSDSEFSGKSYALNAADTIIFETVSLLAKDGEVYYIPVVRDQNAGKPVAFKTTFSSSSKFIVENPAHDFPQVISYTRTGQDQLVAEISGPSKNGEYKYQTFAMKRYPDTKSKNIALVSRVFDHFNAHDWESMASLYKDPAEFKDPNSEMQPVMQTRADIVNTYEQLEHKSPDIKDVVISIYPSGQHQVIVEFISSGTTTDGIKWRLPIVTVFTIENNQVVKDFTYYDK